MAAYKGMSRRIKDALKEVVSDIQYDTGSGSEDAFYLVTDSTKREFDGYPVLQILPNDYTTEKAAKSQNDRAVALVLRVNLQLEGATVAETDVYDHMYDLTDLLLDELDKADRTDDLNTVDPQLKTWSLNAMRGDWIVTPTANGSVLQCDVNVEVKYSKDLV